VTLAICIVCGAQKFGAFVPCGECGFEPTELADKAKSLALSDHHFPPAELDKFSRALKDGVGVPFDPISLAVVARPIAEENYYWENLDDSTGMLRCMQCGVEFRPETDAVLCPLCRARTEEPLSICLKCSLIFDSEAKCCQKCGAELRVSSKVTVRSLAENIGMGVGRTLDDKDVLAKSNFLAGVRRRLSKEESYASHRELMVLGMYCGLLVLSEAVPSSALGLRITQEMVALYRASHTLRGADTKAADSICDHCLHRFEEYKLAMARDPEKRELWLGNEAAKSCFGIENHIGATTDMMILILHVTKVLQGGVIESIMRREGA
jgi:hypothetical protein